MRREESGFGEGMGSPKGKWGGKGDRVGAGTCMCGDGEEGVPHDSQVAGGEGGGDWT